MLHQKRAKIIDYVRSYAKFLETNKEALDIYDGNLKPYIDQIMASSLSATYYHAIKDRILPINILQRYVNKVSTTYTKPPRREVEDEALKEYLDFYEDAFSINSSGNIADCYSNLFKGFAWEPFIDKDGKPSLRELPFDRFLVMSESESNPEEETIFIKIMGKRGQNEDDILLHVYTDTEFDAFYLSGEEATEYLIENQGLNLYGVIPFVYGKRQKHKLIPTIDSDMLAISKAISVMLSDQAGAQMFSCFTILYGIDVDAENLTLSPNAFWSLKSDKESDKTPSVGALSPTSDSAKVLDFVANVFVIWLETKGIRVGSLGNLSGGSMASGISKIIEEMDVYEVKKKSMEWFKKDEQELWNKKLPKIHNFWIASGMVDPSTVPPMISDVENVKVEVEFEAPKPMLSRSEEIANVKAELEIGTMTIEAAIKALHPDASEDDISELVEGGYGVKGILAGMASEPGEQNPIMG
jgi:hypothetical protein